MPKKTIFIKTGAKRSKNEVYAFDVEMGFTQVYDILTESLPNLSFCSNGILLFIWLCVRATGDYKAGIRVAKDVMSDFNEYLEGYGRKRISKSMFYRYVNELCEKGMFVKEQKGFYRFNAEYLWRGSMVQRIEWLKLEAQENKGLLPLNIENQ